jgi:hypothetical protein
MGLNFANKWLVSYETLLFNTPDGDLDVGQYALDGNGTGYYVRIQPKTEANFQHVSLKYDVSGLSLVNIIPGHAYYDEFLTAAGQKAISESPFSPLPPGSIVRRADPSQWQLKMRGVKDAVQPSRIEKVDALPPILPIKSILGDTSLAGHHSIGFDAASGSGRQLSVSSYSWSHTCTGDNLLLVFGDSHNNGSDTDRTVTGVTYNGVAMTLIRSDLGSATSFRDRTTLFYLIAPASGSHTVAVTLSGTVDDANGGVMSYTGARQNNQPDSHNGATGTGVLATVDVTTLYDNCWVVDVVYLRGAFGACGNTSRWADSGAGEAGADTNGVVHPAGAQTMSWAQGSGLWVISAASFAPYELLFATWG